MNHDLPTMDDGVSVHNGFPNPALDRRGQTTPLALDLNRLLIRSPSSTYLFRIAGQQYSDQGIYDGDIAVIERAGQPRAGDFVILWSDSHFALRRRRELTPPETAWGTVTAIIHQYR
jgi:DNA polymerase V